MIDLLFLARGREEFTEASAAALLENTNWDHVRSLHCYFDGVGSSALNRLVTWHPAGFNTYPHHERIGGPVAIMNHYLAQPDGAELVMKCDNDVIVPPGWLEQCLSVMEAHPELDLLGIEPPESRTANPERKNQSQEVSPEIVKMMGTPVGEQWGAKPTYAPCDSVGGIGLFRRRAFEGRPLPESGPSDDGRSGFWRWQKAHPEVVKGWVVPPLRLFLLDRLPIQPWLSYSEEYEKDPRVQRKWTRYSPEIHQLWDWWQV